MVFVTSASKLYNKWLTENNEVSHKNASRKLSKANHCFSNSLTYFLPFFKSKKFQTHEHPTTSSTNNYVFEDVANSELTRNSLFCPHHRSHYKKMLIVILSRWLHKIAMMCLPTSPNSSIPSLPNLHNRLWTEDLGIDDNLFLYILDK